MSDTTEIKLISPRMSLRPMDSAFKRVLSPSLSLVTIATLIPKNSRVWIEDENITKLDTSDKPDIVGLTVNVDTSERAFEIAAIYREKGAAVIFGGIHASANPELMLKHCDSVVVGEAENVWQELIDDFRNGRLKPLYRYEGVTDLSRIPIPDWKYVKRNKYLYHNIIVTSRGCPFKCDFCYNSDEYISSPFRNRPIESVLKEIDALKTKQVMFIDDNFIGNIEWTRQLVSHMKEKGLTWHAAVSTNIYHHKELIDDFAASGCKSLFIGFESIVEESIASVSKRQNKIREYEQLITLLHSKGIMVNASLVFGFDHDRPDVFHKTLDWLVKNKIETMTAHILTPYPGTVLYKRLLAEGRITDFDTSRYNTSNVVFQPKQITADELKAGYTWLYREFYSLKNIVRRKPDNPKIVKPYFLFNLCYRKYGKFTSLFGKIGIMNALGKLARKISYGIE